MTSRRWTIALCLVGATMLVVSVAWWWVVFRQVVGSALISLPRAVHCLAGSSDLCTLAQALCTSSNHFLGIRRYQTFLFWSGWGLVAAAVLTRRPSKGKRFFFEKKKQKAFVRKSSAVP